MSTYCRICQIKSENEVNIFEIYQDKYDLTEIIYELSQIEVSLFYIVLFVNIPILLR